MADGAKLRVGKWAGPEALGSIILLPGRAEFIEKYTETLGELIDRGFAVGIVDLRGQGLSSRSTNNPTRGHISDFSDYVEDVLTVLDGPFADLPKPWILMSHSTGGNIAARLLAKAPGRFNAAVFSAPMLGLQTGGYPHPIARFIASVACILGLAQRFVPGGSAANVFEEPFEQNQVTHDPIRYARTQKIARAEPELALGSATLGWLNAAFRSMAMLAQPGLAETITTPCLFVLAGQEAIADNQKTEAFARRVPNAKIFEIAGARHELLMETTELRASFWQAFDVFISDTLPKKIKMTEENQK